MSEYQYAELPNGIRLVHKQVISNVAHCGIMINTGSRDENNHEQGIAHFIEHVIFKGTGKRNMFQVLNRLEDVGGELNAFTTKEETCIYASFLNHYYKRTIELISDILFNSTFPEGEIEKEKDIVIDELNSYNDNPTELIFDEFEELVFKGHPIGRNILGNKESIKKISRQKLLHFMAENYHTNEIVFCSAGKIHFQQLYKWCEKYFSAVKPNPRKKIRKVFDNYSVKKRIAEKSYFQSHLIIGNVAYSHHNPKKNTLVLLNNILGGPGLNSKLSLSLREKNGFCYNVESLYTPYSDTGILAIYVAGDKEHFEKTISLTYKELEKLKNIKQGSLQLKRYKQQLIGQLAISNESNSFEMMTMGKSVLIYNQVDTLSEINRKIESITAEQLLDVANEIFCTGSMSSLYYLPS